MTRKRFKKLLMGRYGYSRVQAVDAADVVIFKSSAADGGYIFLHVPNKSYSDTFNMFAEAESVLDAIMAQGGCYAQM